MLTPLTEKEIEQLNDLYMNHGMSSSRWESIKFLKKKFGFSDVHNIIVELRKKYNKDDSEMWNKYHETYKNSTLDDKLILRLNENE